MKNIRSLSFVDIERYVSHENVVRVTNTFMYLDPNKKKLDFPYQMAHLSVSICLTGGCVLKIDKEEYVVKAPAIVAVLPLNVIEEVEVFPNTSVFGFLNTAEMLVGFDLEEIPQLYEFLMTRRVLKVMNGYEKYLVEQFHQCQYIASFQTPYVEKCINHIVRSLFYHPLAILNDMDEKCYATDNETNNKHVKLCSDCQRLIQDQCLSKRFESWYADKLGCSVSHLNKVMKKLTGRTVTEQIHNALLQKAMLMLQISSMRSTEIAFKLGFKSGTNFNNFFQRHTGVTPTVFRKTKL